MHRVIPPLKNQKFQILTLGAPSQNDEDVIAQQPWCASVIPGAVLVAIASATIFVEKLQYQSVCVEPTGCVPIAAG